LLALASPELDIAAITTVFGNGPVDVCTENAHRILGAAGRRDIPVFAGAAKPLLREPTPGWASHVHGQDALGETGLARAASGPSHEAGKHASLAITELALASPGEFTIRALGRLTNVALALALEPSLADAVEQIVVMGGAINVPGNVSPVASANLYEDPEAAAMVYRSGVPIVQVGLDVCNRVTVTPSQLETIADANTPASQLLTTATRYLQASYEKRGLLGPGDGVRYNDMPAVGYLIDPTLFTTTRALVRIETKSDLTRGQTVADWDAADPNAAICMEVDADRLTALFTHRISALE
jgi:inosine-uridine nucleoside N-ribohydrolase